MIRKAKVEDAQSIVKINIEGWQNTYKNIFLDKFLNSLNNKVNESIIKCQNKIDEYRVYVINNEVVGFIRYGINKKNYSKEYAEIYALYINKKYQGQGIGTKLIKYALNELKEKYKYVLVSTIVQNSANEFYQKVGFNKIGISKFSIDNNTYEENLYLLEISQI